MGTVILKIKPSNEPDLSQELTHYGIKGQRKGVRRYQNEDGSLTPAGKIRYYGTSKGNSSGSDSYGSSSMDKHAKGAAAALKTAMTSKPATSTGSSGGTTTTPKSATSAKTSSTGSASSAKATPTSGGSKKATKDKTISDVSDILDAHREHTKDTKGSDDSDDGYEVPSKAVSAVKVATGAGRDIADGGAGIASRKRIDVPRMDLRNKTDDELRKEIARDRLEEEYDKQFNVNRHKAEAGRQRVVDTWKNIGDGVKIAGGIATLILLIQAARKS